MRIARATLWQVLCIASVWSSPQASPAQVGGTASSAVRAAVSTCAKECHQDIINHPVMHSVSRERCDACHVQGNAKQHRFSFIVAKDQLCVRCHAVPHEGVMHAPVQQGRCLECHDPHGSDHPRSLIADPQRALCVKCHTQEFPPSQFVHGPVAVGACIVCHKPHSSKEPGLLVKDSRSLCLTCHAEVQTEGQREGHVHGALEQGCTSCHDPHASAHKFQLRERSPELCMKCHQAHFDKLTAAPAHVHGAIQEPDGCLGCHQPHSSQLAGLQRGSQPGICLSCHNRPVQTAAGGTIPDMARLLEENPDHHGPIRDGNCTACHEPHAGENFRLLKEEYPAEFYAPFAIESFRLCFRCHIPDLVLSASGSGLTEFRDGDRNLHHVHVNRDKGRTCRSCHEVHASKQPSHIRESVPFGAANWKLPLNYKKTPEGGSCMPGCHEVRRYSRSPPVSGSAAASPSPDESPDARRPDKGP